MTARIPRVPAADGLYPLFTCAVVEIRCARLKSIAVVTAIWPRRLNLAPWSTGSGESRLDGGGLPASDPGKEGGELLRSEHVGPKVWATGSWY